MQTDTNTEKLAQDVAVKGEPGKVPTDVEDIYADGEKGGLPVFDVSQKDFNQNMSWGRKRVRFASDTVASQYMRQTKYQIPFWIRDKETGYTRKIK